MYVPLEFFLPNDFDGVPTVGKYLQSAVNWRENSSPAAAKTKYLHV